LSAPGRIRAVEIFDTLDFLLGHWRLDRSIDDHKSGTRGSFHGTAVVVAVSPGRGPDADGRASYRETGELRLGGYSGPASRRLEYAARPDGAGVLVSFADGRPFIDLDLRDGTSHGVHQCRDDRYELTTTVRSQGVVEERWQVRGPDKDYDAVTTLTRIDR
jgi:hypothetical protein